MNKKFKLKITIFLSTLIILELFNVLPLFANSINNKNYIEDEIIVKYKDNKINLNSFSGIYKAQSINVSTDTEKKEDLPSINSEVLTIKDGSTVEDKITELQSDPNVEYAQPNYKYYPSIINTNDTYKDNLWGLDNTGQTVNGIIGTNNSDINAPEAWSINEGNSNPNNPIVVAIIDTGVAYNHPDLLPNMWDGSHCKDENGNVLDGCAHGYDYESNDKIPLPDILQKDYYHGSHIAGIISAVKNNNKVIIGVAPNAKIMGIKSSLTTSNIIKGIDFAQQNGASIINASWGGFSNDLVLKNRISTFPGLFIAAAGNCGGNDYVQNGCSFQNQTFYPAAYGLSNIISVAATDSSNNLATFSNYSSSFIDIGAPGVNILSTVTLSGDGSDELYGYLSGTSMATPYVTGLAALIEGYRQDLTSSQVKNVILTTGKDLNSLSSKTVTGKIIDAQKALASLTSTKKITSFNLTNPLSTGVVNENNHTISLSVPFGTDVTSLIPTIIIDGASINPNTLVAQDFTNPVNYTVTALDGSTQIYTITIHVNPSDSMIVSSDKSALTEDLIKGSNSDLSHIKTTLVILPLLGSNGSTITWVSSDLNIVSSDGQTITRPTFGTSDATVNLTATLTKGLITDTKVFNLIILEQENPDIALVSYDKSALTEDLIKGSNIDLSHITTSLSTLPLLGSNESTITWLSSNTSIVSNDGQTITRPTFGTSDATVTLTATLNKGIVTDTKVFNLVILAHTLDNISITTPATKLSYKVGESLDISGLLVTGTYSDNSTKQETITLLNITGFNSAIPTTGQVLTITVGDKTTTYTVDIVASPVVNGGGGGGGGGGSSSTTPTVVIKPVVIPVTITPVVTNPEIIPTTLQKEELIITPLITFTKVLKINSKGTEVKQLQNILIKNKYLSSKVDGVFGKQTKLAIMKFQKDHNLTPDGIVGPKTLKFMK